MRYRFLPFAILLLGIVLVISLATCHVEQEPVLHSAPALQWSKTLNGGVGRSVQQTKDGGYIICGWKGEEDYNTDDALLIKTDASGNKIWEKVFGSEGKSREQAYSVQQTIDGGYIIGGCTERTDLGIWLLRTDADGDKIWEKSFTSHVVSGYIPVQQTSDGGYIICQGNSMIKTDAAGNETWKRMYDHIDAQVRLRSLQQILFGRYIICGSIIYNDPKFRDDVWLAKIGANGDKLWEKTFSGERNDEGFSVLQTKDGGYIIGGITQFISGEHLNSCIWLIKTDAAGDVIWSRTFEEGTWLYSVEQTMDGGYIICGNSGLDVWLMKTHSNGDKLWDKTFEDVSSGPGYSCKQTKDGGYIVLCGGTQLLKLAPEQ